MRITPLDVRKQEFRKGMRGLDADEVYAFLATVADEYEAVLNDNNALRERVLELDDKVEEYRSMERNLRDTLLTAERVTADAKDNARREANLIIKEAQIDAEKQLRDIKNEAMRLRQQITELRSQREGYVAKMKLIAESYLRFIDTSSNEFSHEDDSIPDVADARSDRSVGTAPSAPGERTDLFEASGSTSEHGAAPGAGNPQAAQSGMQASAGMSDPQPSPPIATPVSSRPAQSPSPAPQSDQPTASAPQEAYRGSADPIATPTGEAGEGLSDIGAILERMKRGQQEMLNPDYADGTPSPSPPQAPATEVEPAQTPQTATAVADPPAPSDAERFETIPRPAEDSSTWQRMTDPQPSAEALADPPAAREDETTGKWDLDEIRRHLAEARRNRR